MAEPKKIRAKVVCHHYGRHFRGDIIEVDEQEYRRVGRWVLLSKEDEDAQRKREEASRAQQMSRTAEERSMASGWVEKEQEALRITRQRFLDEQRRQRELLTGAPTG